MSVSIDYGFDKIQEIMKTCIETEMVEGGLLEDVETFIPIYYEEQHVEEPVIWMTQHTANASRQADITQTMDLIIPFEFDCAVYERELEDSINASQNLATRVVLSIVRNFLTVQNTITNGRRIIKNIGLETYYPVGYVDVNGKSERLPVTGVIINVTLTINWVLCCRQLQNTNNGD